ncbi:MAG TPA: TldD/PmbA family protein [Geomonas sp.]|nr:TldD/PmbA family protein [Geomonas sp.]
MELSRHADSVESLLKGKELDGYEIAVQQSRDLSVEAKGGKLDAFKCSEPLGLAIRVKCGDGLGFSFSTALDPASLERMVEGALVAARSQTPDPCHGLPLPVAGYPELAGLWDEGLSFIPQEKKIERALELERLTLAGDPRLKRVRKCSYSESAQQSLIRNSHGLCAFYQSSYVSCSISVVAEQDGAAQMAWDFDFANRFSDLDLQVVAQRAGSKATSLLGARTIATMRCPAVLDNHVASDLLEVLSASFLGDNVVKGKSLLRGRVGEQLFSGLITVRDNGILPGGMGSAPCDGEGVPQQDTLLVSKGVLQQFLYDSYWGRRMGQASTGNSTRGSIKMPPRLGAHNLFIETGPDSFQNLVKSVGKGILITDVMGIHTANPISGDFSVGAAGFYLEGGEIVHPVKGIAIAGNLLELFGGVDMVADDLRFFGSVGSPALRVAELDVSGS